MRRSRTSVFVCSSAAIVALAASVAMGACSPWNQKPTIKVGALFPLSNSQSPLAGQELAGVRMAADLVNADGGVAGRPVELLVRDLSVREDADNRVAALDRAGVNVIVGTYSSSLSMPASEAAAAHNLVYWEAGAVADQVTGSGLPLVFRIGATGGNLGAMSSRFVADVIAPRLGRKPADLRMAIIQEGDAYGTSVGAGAANAAEAAGIPIVRIVTYDAYAPDWHHVIDSVRASGADILVLASYIPDGVAFREAMLASHLHVDALIGSTMAECGPEFGALLGVDAIGVFASDRPPSSFNPSALNPTGLAAFDRLMKVWRRRYSGSPTEEALSGFAAGWALFHYVLPAAARAGDLTPQGIARVARLLELPAGSLADGAGVRFSQSPDNLGQNLAATSVVWQWQAVRESVTVYPPVFATGAPIMIPLPR